MYAVEYLKPKSLAEASDLLGAHPEAKLLGGGMTLIPTLKQRLARPSHLVDIAALPELSGIGVDGAALVIGAATRHDEIARSKLVQDAIAALARLADGIGDPQVRSMGTIGGSLANNDPAADYPAALLALGGSVVTDRREIAVADYFLGLFTTALEDGEIVVRVRLPLPRRAAYMKFPHPASGYCMSGVFVAETGGGVRVAVTGGGNGVFRWPQAEAALARRMAADALDGLSLDIEHFTTDLHGSREYRANLARVMAARAVAQLAN